MAPRLSAPGVRIRRRRGSWSCLALAAVGLSAVALGGCASDPPFPFDDAACEAALTAEGAVAADAWLKDPHGGEKHLGSWSTDMGLAFFHTLEQRGAATVTAVGVHSGAAEEGGPSQEALGLVVRLPDDPAARRRLFELHAQQTRAAGYQPVGDRGQKYLFFCWKT